MKKINFLIIFCMLITSVSFADEKQVKDAVENSYQMSLMQLHTEDYPHNSKWVILLNKTWAFNSVDALKAFLKLKPKGTKLIWNPGCMRIGNEPLLSNPAEMKSFEEFCIENEIDFVIRPSG